jgi:proline dehydrogenase
MAVTIGYFHNADDSSVEIADISQQIIESVAALNPQGYLSVKAPALGYDAALLSKIIEIASRHDVLTHFDSHEHHTADPTFDCIQRAALNGGKIGVTIPARWPRSLNDALEAAKQGLRIRIVKGEWADPRHPNIDVREAFLKLVDCLAGKTAQVAIATHDPKLAEASILCLRAKGTSCELELLNGLPRHAMLSLAAQYNIPVRFYIPFGIAWRSYAISKVRENPNIIWWVIKDAA